MKLLIITDSFAIKTGYSNISRALFSYCHTSSVFRKFDITFLLRYAPTNHVKISNRIDSIGTGHSLADLSFLKSGSVKLSEYDYALYVGELQWFVEEIQSLKDAGFKGKSIFYGPIDVETVSDAYLSMFVNCDYYIPFTKTSFNRINGRVNSTVLKHIYPPVNWGDGVVFNDSDRKEVRKKFQVSDTDVLLGTICIPSDRKGFGNLVQAMSQAMAEDKNIKWLLHGPPEYKNNYGIEPTTLFNLCINTFFDDENLRKRIILTSSAGAPVASPQWMNDIYNAIDGMVMFSNAEGFCYPVYEMVRHKKKGLFGSLPEILEAGEDSNYFIDRTDTVYESMSGSKRAFWSPKEIKTEILEYVSKIKEGASESSWDDKVDLVERTNINHYIRELDSIIGSEISKNISVGIDSKESNIVFATEHLIDYSGGAEKSLLHIADKCNAPTVSVNYGLSGIDKDRPYNGKNYSVNSISDIGNFLCDNFNELELVVTQLNATSEVNKFCTKNGVKYAVFARSFDDYCINPGNVFRCDFKCNKCKINGNFSSVVKNAEMTPFSFIGLDSIRRVNTKCFSEAEFIVSNSKFTQSVMKKIYGLDSEVCYPYIDKAKYSEFRSTNFDKKILLSNANTYQKGLGVIKSIADKLDGWQVHIVGEIQNKKAIDGAKNIITHGNVNIIDFCRENDPAIFLATPMFYEAFGRMNIEVQLMNIPCLSLDNGGCSETAFLFYDNISGAADYVSEVFDNLKDAKDHEISKGFALSVVLESEVQNNSVVEKILGYKNVTV